MQQRIHLDHGIPENAPAGRCNTVWRSWPWGPDIFPYMISHFHAPSAYDKAPTVVMHNLWLPWFVNFIFQTFYLLRHSLRISISLITFGLIPYHHSTGFIHLYVSLICKIFCLVLNLHQLTRHGGRMGSADSRVIQPLFRTNSAVHGVQEALS